jgi:type IV pilus assembly protein PilZ
MKKMGSKSSAGQRKHPRYNVNIQVDCTTRDMFVSHYVTSLSKGGVFVETEDPLPIQSEVHLKLTLPESHQTIEAKGTVAWTYDIKKGTGGHVAPGMGIKFVDLSPEHRTLLEDYVQQLSSSSE